MYLDKCKDDKFVPEMFGCLPRLWSKKNYKESKGC